MSSDRFSAAENGESIISFTEVAEITNGKADAMYSALSNEIEKCGGVGFENDKASVIIWHKKVVLKLKRNNAKMISILCHNYRLALAILPFFKESTFLITNNYLMC